MLRVCPIGAADGRDGCSILSSIIARGEGEMDVRQLTGLAAISQDELRDVTRRLCYFAAKGSQNYVSELMEFLVLNSLAKLDPGAHYTKEIYSKLRELISFQFEYEQVLSALRRLESKETVYVVDDHSDDTVRFGLPVDQISELTQKYKEQMSFETEVLQAWREELEGRYPDLGDSELDALEEDLEAFSLRLYSFHSVESVALYFGDDDNVVGLLNDMDEDTIRDILPERDSKLRIIRMRELPQFFFRAPLERKRFIGQQLNQIFLLHMMQLDSKCARLASQQIRGGTLFLDTNVLIRLLGIDGPELQDATKRLMDLSQGLGYKAVVSPRTLEEYRFTIGDLVEKARVLPPIAPEVAEAALSVTLGQDFYAHYWQRSMDTKGYLSRQGYYEVFKQVEPFLEEYNISVDSNLDEAIRADVETLQGEEVQLRRSLPRLIIHSSVAEHDAHHRILILGLRAGYEETSPLEVPYWFLTCDTKLPVYDRRVRQRQGLIVPFCVLTSHWMQLLRPFAAAVEGFDVVLADTLNSPIFRLFPSPPTELVQDIINRMAANERIPPAVIVKIITNDAFVRVFSEETDQAKREELLQDRVLDEVAALLEGEQKKLAKEREKLRGEREQFQKDRREFHQQQQQDALEKEQLDQQIQELRAQVEQAAEQEVLNRRSYEQLARTFEQEQAKQRALMARQQKTVLIILAWIACGASLIAVSPWSKTGNLRWLTLTFIVSTAAFMQLVIFWKKGLSRLALTFLLGINVIALTIAVVLPLGINISDAVVGIMAVIQGTSSIYAMLEHLKDRAKSQEE
jgi:hemerythrin-like domain-containing protein